ncbi:chs1 [Cordylochernes scorpioides]|uniref:chitin synthase n=1 Tax=Cordylochernes scorpioides TaxID=51811 RepID=A0ABY6LV72_9ARAC|nr:chs1 [Cordylochernes scorpioides]
MMPTVGNCRWKHIIPCYRYNIHSLLKIDSHIFFDDAYELCEDLEEDVMVVNRWVKLLLQAVPLAASSVHQCHVRLSPPLKIPTPYGGRLEWTLPGKNKLVAHLKDKCKIRHKKRWSQVMYMYYLLGHRLMELPVDSDRKKALTENTYILALDGDINFRPQAVRLLVDLMKKNPKLGAACGRIHPVGTGPMVWYQKFEYAMGHWLQKATEHMIGCVLCSPGCFSLFRAKALMEDNVMRRYATTSTEASHYVQYDQGEDRWLCTLILQRGYRVEYCAASDAYTHCPEGFGEFYIQRRRWAPSTLANILDLLCSYRQTVKINDSISMPYVLYQTILMVGTILGPGTIFIMVVGAVSVTLHLHNLHAFLAAAMPLVIFIPVCFFAKNDVQILVAQLLSIMYSLLMVAVFVGTALQFKEDGISSPSAIFLIGLICSFLLAAILHPKEFFCVIHLALYMLSVPSMYLLLTIYALINLNVVSWGTREVPKSKKQLQGESKEIAKESANDLLSWLRRGVDRQEEEGGFSFKFLDLFTCLCCTHSKPDESRLQLLRIEDKLDQISKRWERIPLINRTIPEESEGDEEAEEDRTDCFRIRGGWGVFQYLSAPWKTFKISHKVQAVVVEAEWKAWECPHKKEDTVALRKFREQIKVELGAKDRIVLTGLHEGAQIVKLCDDNTKGDDPFWLKDKVFKKSPTEQLSDTEQHFWKELIDKYLLPLDGNTAEAKEKQDRITRELKELRNKVVSGFFIGNAIFMVTIMLLQMNKEQLSLSWPVGGDYNITFFPMGNNIQIEELHVPLKIEPIGFVFAMCFFVILFIQFVGMLLHRFGTFAHIISSVKLSCCSRDAEDKNIDSIFNQSAVEFVKALHQLKTENSEMDQKNENNIVLDRPNNHVEANLDAAFEKRFRKFSMTTNVRQSTAMLKDLDQIRSRPSFLKIIENRRNTLLANTPTPSDRRFNSNRRQCTRFNEQVGSSSPTSLNSSRSHVETSL